MRERVRLRDRPCDPSLSCPSYARYVPPHLGYAFGSPPALSSPLGTCARSSPVSLLLSPTPSPLVSCGIMPGIPAPPLDAMSADNIVAEARGFVMPTMA